MSERHVEGTAVVVLKLRIVVDGGAWGPECSIEQIHKQAERDAFDKIGLMIEGSRMHGIQVVSGSTEVTAVLVKKKVP